MGFGWYCRIHEEDQPRNGMVQRTQGAILLEPSGKAQGGHKFFTLTTGKVVTHRIWTELPTSVAVIERVALLAKGMPALLSLQIVPVMLKWLLVGFGQNCPHPWLSLREWLYWLRVCQHSLSLQIMPVV